MNKKKIKLIFFGVIIAIFFTACGNNKYKLDPENPVTLCIWHYYNGEQKLIFDEKIEEFNSTIGKEKGIIIEAYNQGDVSELTQKIMDSVNHVVGAEKMPDMFAAYADTAYNIDTMGLAANIEDYLSEKEQDEYILAYLDEGKFQENGGIKLFPIAKATEVLAINKTEWDKFADATKASEENLATWEGIAQLGKEYYEWTDKLTDKPNDGKAFFGRDAMANYLIIGSMQLGHEIFQVKNGEVVYDLDEKVMKKLWDNYYIPYVNGYYASYGRFRSDDVKTGDIIAFVGSTSGVTYFPTEVTREDGTSYPIESKVYPLPNFKGTDPYAVQQGAGILVVKSEKIKEFASVLFLKWFTEVENNVEFSIQSGYLPVKKAANTKEEVNKISNISDILKETIYTGIDITNQYHLYTNKAFEEGNSSRRILENALSDKAFKDRKKIVKLINKGVPRAEALSDFISEKNFQKWYQEIKQNLLAIRDEKKQ